VLQWSLVFLLVALVAAIFGFGEIAAPAVGIAKVLFVVFLALGVIALISGFARGRVPSPGPPG
jgi:uncharacterized membrane protein YtjA (UPF0391 family)